MARWNAIIHDVIAHISTEENLLNVFAEAQVSSLAQHADSLR